MRKRLAGLIGFAAIAVTGCVAPVGASSVSIPKDARNVCAYQCGTLGMGLSAVAIMANNIGCVCQGGPFDAKPQASSGGASATAGMATIAMLRAQQEAAAQQQQRLMAH